MLKFDWAENKQFFRFFVNYTRIPFLKRLEKKKTSDFFIKHTEISVSNGVWKKITFFIKCVGISVSVFSFFKCAKVSFFKKKDWKMLRFFKNSVKISTFRRI